jgi:gliding-associated putative ABC transporter substrate-binding component GldG
VLAIIVAINALSQYFYRSFDLTEDERFTLTEPTTDLLTGLQAPIYVQVLLSGKLPIQFQRLQSAAIDMLNQYEKLSGNQIQYELIDPSDGTTEQINKMRKELSEEGIFPTTIRVMESDEMTEKLIYPYILFRLGTRVHAVNILESEAVAVSPDIQLNNSISLLEYKYSNAIQKLLTNQKSNIAFLQGHGELQKYETYDLENTLRKFYNTGHLYLDSVYKIDQRIELVIIPKPTMAFAERDKFILDQYVMKGGKIMWLIDKLNVSLDSIRANTRYVPFENNLNLDDFFFKHGIRLNPDLIQDLECTRIPLTVNQTGSRPQYELFPWYYHILAVPAAGHPITNNLDRVNLFFPSTLDTLKSKYNLSKTVLLTSSDYSRFQLTPVQLDMNIVRVPPVPEKFNKPNLPVAVLLEGKFASLYENRVTADMEKGLTELGEVYSGVSEPNKMMVITDGDLPYNNVKNQAQEYWPLGYNIYERRAFANKEFLLNSIEYLIGDGGVLSARTKEVKLRLLDTVKANQEQLKWQVINVVLPLAGLLVFGLLYFFVRKRKYGRKLNRT